MRVVKQLNTSILNSAEVGSISGDALLTLNLRTNEYFTKFVGAWLKSEAIARHFVFELGGFEFLLDTISNENSQNSLKDGKDFKGEPASHVNEEKQI